MLFISAIVGLMYTIQTTNAFDNTRKSSMRCSGELWLKSVKTKKASFDNAPLLTNNAKVYVGNLPFDVEEIFLLDAMEQNDIDMTRVITPLSIPRGKSKTGQGIAFIEVIDKDTANKVIEVFNGLDFFGRILKSSIYTPSGEQKIFTGVNQRKSNKPVTRNSVFLGNIDYNFDNIMLSEMVEDLVGPGTLVQINRPIDKRTKQPREFAYIELKDEKYVSVAIEQMNGLQVLDRVLKCEVMMTDSEIYKIRHSPSSSSSLISENSKRSGE